MSGAIYQTLHLWLHEIDEYLWRTVYLASACYNYKELSYQMMCCICIKHAHIRNLNDKGKTCTSSMRTVVGERKSRRCSRTIAESRMTNILQVLAGALFSLKIECIHAVIIARKGRIKCFTSICSPSCFPAHKDNQTITSIWKLQKILITGSFILYYK